MSSFIPVRANFTVEQGTDWSRCITLMDPANPLIPWVFPYVDAYMQLKEDYGLPAVASLTVAGGGIVLTAAEGKIEMKLSDIITSLLPVFDEPVPFLFDLFCMDGAPDPLVDKVAKGFIIVNPRVSGVPV